MRARATSTRAGAGSRLQLRASVPESTYRLWFEPPRRRGRPRSHPLPHRPPARPPLGRPALPRAAESRPRARRTRPSTRSSSSATRRPDGGDGAADTPAEAAARVALNPAYTFERFVIGPGNRLAHGAALAVAEAPGQAYNPLFLHGPPGLGKTHLLGAIANYLHERSPELAVHYTTAETFTNEFVVARPGQAGIERLQGALPPRRRAADRRRPVPRRASRAPPTSSSTPSTPSTRPAPRSCSPPTACRPSSRPWPSGCASASSGA